MKENLEICCLSYDDEFVKKKLFFQMPATFFCGIRYIDFIFIGIKMIFSCLCLFSAQSFNSYIQSFLFGWATQLFLMSSALRFFEIAKYNIK